MRRLLALSAALLSLAAPASAHAGTAENALSGALSREMNRAGAGSSAFVLDLGNGRQLFARRADTPRIPASNEKLYTTAVAIMRFGASERLATRVLGTGRLDENGTYTGSLFLRGAGDPTFGTGAFNRRAYGTGTSVGDLARAVAEAGISRVQGAVYGDETLFDGLRGGPDSGFAFSFYIGAPLSALSFNRGLGNTRGTSLQRRPATFAANQLTLALRAEGVSVSGAAGQRATPAGARELASVRSPTIATLARLTNVPSDNFFAEMLLKTIGARFAGRGSTAAGAAAARSHLAQLSIFPRLRDGSGLSRGNRTSPRQVVRLLDHMDRTEGLAVPFRQSLAVACRSGTIGGRMCRTAAAGRCRGKTGTLSGVSALSGYCDLPGGRVIAFSFLMNRVNVSGARRLQDRMAAAIARYRPSSPAPGAASRPAEPARSP